MSDTPENVGFNPEKSRPVVDRIKNEVKQTGVLIMTDSEERESAANKVLMAAGIQGVDNLSELLDATRNKNVKGVDEKVLALGVAIGESILESDNQDLKKAVIAGSFSTERILPKGWKIRKETEQGDVSLATVICDGIVNVPNRERKTQIIQIMEWVDFCKNNEEQVGGGLYDQLNNAIRELSELGKTSLSSNERLVIKKRLDYLQGMKGESSGKNKASTILDRGVESLSKSIVDFSEAVEDMAEYNRKFQNFYKQERQSVDEYDPSGETEEQYKARTGETLIRKDNSFPYNKDYSYQLAWVEERLQHIEHYQTENIKRELALGHYYTYPLFDVLAQGRAPQEILEMIESRLTLKAIGDAVAKNNGTMGSRQEFINVLNGLENEGFDLSPEVIMSFFENEIATGIGGGKYGNLRTAEAWNLMEMANFGYETMLNWAYIDGSDEIRKAIDEYNRIGSLNKPEGYNVKDFFKMKGIVGVGNKSLDDTRFKGIKRNYFLDKSGKEGKTVEFTAEGEGKRVKEKRQARANILRNYMIEKITREIAVDYKLGKLTDEERKVFLDGRKDYTKIISYKEAIEGLNSSEISEMKKIATVSMEVSESMFSATGENSVVNWDFIAGDEVAEVFNIQLLRILDGERNGKGKAAGPQGSLLHILTLSPGFVRQFSSTYNPDRAIYAGENRFLEEIVAAKQIKELIKNGYSNEGDKFIDSQQKIDYEKLNNKGLWAAYWFSIWGKKLWPAREEILDSTIPTKKDLLDETYYQRVIDHFNKVDSQIGTYGKVQAAWLAGKVQGALYRMLSEWSENDFTMLEALVTEKYFSTKDGTRLPFVTKEQWGWIEKLTNMRGKITGDKALDVVGSVITPGRKR